MDTERARAFLLTLPHVVETMQWGDNLVFWVGDKVIGGKMFTLMDLGAQSAQGAKSGPVVSFAAGAERAAELCEREGLIPAPYLARAGWVAAESWDALRGREWQEQFATAHAVVAARLAPRTRAALALPEKARTALIKERRQMSIADAKVKSEKVAAEAKASPGTRVPRRRGSL